MLSFLVSGDIIEIYFGHYKILVYYLETTISSVKILPELENMPTSWFLILFHYKSQYFEGAFLFVDWFWKKNGNWKFMPIQKYDFQDLYLLKHTHGNADSMCVFLAIKYWYNQNFE